MPFDKPTRNALARMVAQARETLKADLTAQLQTEFRLAPDGNHLPLTGLSAAQREAALALRALLDHYAAQLPNHKSEIRNQQSFDRLARDIGFTVLNRLAALRLAEERELVQECVRRGLASEGFQLFERVAGGGLGSRYAAYRLFLENLFDELALDLGALFDRAHPLSAPFPSERALTHVLELLNDPALAALWREDETIGWIYQYYNDDAERKQMRDESQAPRNSRELAVRNQFFTPRYVVEFLTDNTLGRLWYEMTGGQTRLAEQCRYLVKDDHRDVTLSDSEGSRVAQPGDSSALGGAPQSDNPRATINNQKSPIRNLKDPRTITMLDPAGGSGHFALYCFDLFETIYEEAWEMQASGAWTPPILQSSNSLLSDYPTLAALRRDLPRLILQHNLHIIDIDPRAVQIAALALWLRAQRRWQTQGVRAADRPRITRMNVVCAEPMPGERDLLEEFIDRHLSATAEGRVLAALVRVVFEKMQLAGEAGSLLKIEDELRESIATLKREWLARPEFTQPVLLGEAPPVQAALDLDTTGITDEAFWDEAETRTLAALQAYAETAEDESVPRPVRSASRRPDRSQPTARRKLFADDAAHGFAFIDLCRKRYDVVLMNPPFGDASSFAGGEYIPSKYPSWNNNLLCAFIENAWEKSYPKGFVGAIYDRTAIVKSTYDEFRRSVLLPEDRLQLLIDLGWGVLDANVEVTTSILSHQGKGGCFIDARNAHPDSKQAVILDKVSEPQRLVFHSSLFLDFPNAVVGYDFPEFLRHALERFPSLEASGFKVNVGHQLKAEKHFRLWWELPATINGYFVRMFNGAGFSPYATNFYDCITSPVDIESLPRDSFTTLRNKTFQFKSGVCFGKRGEYFCLHLLPRDFVFTVEGQSITGISKHSALVLLGLLNTPLVRFSLNKWTGQHKTSGYVNIMPLSTLIDFEAEDAQQVISTINLIREAQNFDELQPNFRTFIQGSSLYQYADTLFVAIQTGLSSSRKCESFWHEKSIEIYGVSAEERVVLDSFRQNQVEISSAIDDSDIEQHCHWLSAHFTLSQIVGFIFARWDIRLALDPTLAPKLQDPFDPLPVCPPGMLVGVDGLPATSGGIVSEAWLRARPNAITLPKEEEGRKQEEGWGTIRDDEYPPPLAWDGVLVDDPNVDSTGAEHPHPQDIVGRVRAALAVLWGDKAESIEAEACELLNVKSLRDYFRNFNKGFFGDHLKRYSKSRRQAPIYWPLSVPSGRYTLWVYYHRLDGGMLHHLVNAYVSPKIDQVESQLAAARGQTKPAQSLITTLQSLLSELRDFRAELLRVAGLPYTPNLNDGVLLNAAPLYKLFRHSKWAKDCQAAWQALEAGEYEWAHLAYTLWPERVKTVCAQDRSIAIAHGLEALYQGEVKVKKARKGKKQADGEKTIGMELE